MALPPHLADLEQRLASRFAEAVAEYRRAAESRLRQESERFLGALTELPTPPTAFLDPQELAALDLAPKAEARRATLDRLAAALRALDVARGQTEALDALLDAAQTWAGRVALVLARDSGLTVWGDRGFGAGSIAGRELDWDTTLRERLLASRGCLRLDAESAAEVLARFDVDAAGGALVVPLVLRDRIAALLWADGAPPELAALQVLVHAAGQRLELQALSDRAFSPTLWEGAEAPGEPLPLWSVLAPAAAVVESPEPSPRPEPAAEPSASAEALAAEAEALVEPAVESEAEAEETGSGLWEAEPAAAPAIEEAVAEEPPFVAEEPPTATFTELAEGATAAGEVSPPETPPAAIEAEALPEFAYESVESPPDDEASRWEPEPAAPIAAKPPVSPPVEPAPADQLGTVRMQRPALENLSRPAEETTAPLPIVPPVASPAATHEIAAPTGLASDGGDAFSEDATQLSMRRPPLPEPTPGAQASTLAIEPPSWSRQPATPPLPAAPPAPAAPAEDPMDRTASRMTRSTEVAPPPDVSGPGLAFLGGRASRSAADPVHEEAKRLARLLISEIRLYNEEQVLEGRRHRDLYHRLKEDIDRSRQIFDERVDSTVRAETDYFQQELVRSLAGGDPRALGI